MFILSSCGTIPECKNGYDYIHGLCIGGTQQVNLQEIDDIMHVIEEEVQKYYPEVTDLEEAFAKQVQVEFYRAEEACGDVISDEYICPYPNGHKGVNYNGTLIRVTTNCLGLGNSAFAHEILHSIEWFCLEGKPGWGDKRSQHKTPGLFVLTAELDSVEVRVDRRISHGEW